MKAAVTLVVLSALAATLSACGEQQPTPIYGIPRYSDLPRDAIGFDCDAATDFRSEWKQPIGDAGKARGALFFVSVRRARKWPTLANVLIRGPQDDAWISLSFKVDPEGEHLQPEVRTRVSASSEPLTQLLRPRPVSGAAFEIEWEPHIVRVRVESTGPWLEVPMAFTPDQLILGCTSGNAVFHSFHVEPTAATAAKPRRVLPTTPPGDPPPQNVPPTLLVRRESEVTPDAQTNAKMIADGSKSATASFRVCVDETGALTALEKLKSSGYPAYDAELEAAIEGYHYEPYRIADRAVPACTALTFIYSPRSAPHPETPREHALRECDEEQARDRR